MLFAALACDFDGTLAWDGQVEPPTPPTLNALVRLKESGRRLVLVTGRTLDDLKQQLPQLDLFDRLVVENGAVIVNPSTGQIFVRGARPTDDFIAGLHVRGVSPI